MICACNVDICNINHIFHFCSVRMQKIMFQIFIRLLIFASCFHFLYFLFKLSNKKEHPNYNFAVPRCVSKNYHAFVATSETRKETEQEVEGRGKKTNKRNAKGGKGLLTSEAH